MQNTSLRSLQNDLRPHVAEQARAVAAGLVRSGPATKYLDLSIDNLVDAMILQRSRLPDRSSDLSVVDSALIPLLKLHRALFIAQPVEDQIEPSEVDLLTFSISEADLVQTAEELGCPHLCPPTGPQPEEGRVVSIKQRIIVVPTIKIQGKTLSVSFILDTGAPVSFVCEQTLRAFGINMKAQPSNYVRGEVEGGVGAER
mmetsp:Transcript_29277/g.86630  ORF Transcript_29277/g.86630 Transcript_29277/m.86630 type:complete len:200 (-) Transcript_29277:837-1436(-)|eukprot:362220-Chlamydomonas_euryale.AAC.12